jgi:hypothetical protein
VNDDLAQLQASSFGLVTAIEVIEHVANPERIVEVGARCLAPRGWLMITTPNIYSIRARMRFLATGNLDFLNARPRRTTFIHWSSAPSVATFCPAIRLPSNASGHIRPTGAPARDGRESRCRSLVGDSAE